MFRSLGYVAVLICTFQAHVLPLTTLLSLRLSRIHTLLTDLPSVPVLPSLGLVSVVLHILPCSLASTSYSLLHILPAIHPISRLLAAAVLRHGCR